MFRKPEDSKKETRRSSLSKRMENESGFWTENSDDIISILERMETSGIDSKKINDGFVEAFNTYRTAFRQVRGEYLELTKNNEEKNEDIDWIMSTTKKEISGFAKKNDAGDYIPLDDDESKSQFRQATYKLIKAVRAMEEAIYTRKINAAKTVEEGNFFKTSATTVPKKR